jgi:hypothetical protein
MDNLLKTSENETIIIFAHGLLWWASARRDLKKGAPMLALGGTAEFYGTCRQFSYCIFTAVHSFWLHGEVDSYVMSFLAICRTALMFAWPKRSCRKSLPLPFDTSLAESACPSQCM